ncbi:lysine--tRNA ligase [Candidatus Woesearchaeota archaeon CG10_big_fil_rev_8_21_14_0_10_45_16]|nr:MAG: lysine--tRNA ligase [Candidatus Woesearchaeota archaeon CG10_big_fil_rev_8_21_14_0_10_45_16]
MADEESYHWTDVAVDNIIREKGDKKSYTIAAGITPSGTVHIGNFREIITVDLVRRALEKRGKKVRFIYSWDDYDVFRKVPRNMPQQEMLERCLRKSIVDVPDPYGKAESYARHNQISVEEEVKKVGIEPEFIYQSKEYRKCRYAKEIQHALKNTDKIKEVLNEYREKPLEKDWLPIAVFSKKLGTDVVKNLRWDGVWGVSYELEDGVTETVDIRKDGNVKLKWRVDWPMRWYFEKVDFEPGGKDHSTAGGSYDTGKKICKELWGFDAPTYVMYNFINVKGMGGKMSSSSGEVITLADVLEVYEPEIARYIFAGTRPNKEFSISFDADVINIYEEFDKVERIYFGLEEVSEKKAVKFKAAYELSHIGKIPKTIPYQPSFRHLTMLLQIYDFDIDKVIGYFEKELKNQHDRVRLRTRAECAAHWIKKHAPEEFKFTVQKKPSVTVSAEEKKLLHELALKLEERDWTDKDLHEEMYILCKNHEISPKDFFTAAYKVLINKEKGPRLASFILEIGKNKVAELFRRT